MPGIVLELMRWLKWGRLERKYQQTGNPKITPNDELTDREKRIIDIWGSTTCTTVPGGTAGFTDKKRKVETKSIQDSPPESKKPRSTRPEKKIETSSSILNAVSAATIESVYESQKFNELLQQYLSICAEGLMALPQVVKVLGNIHQFMLNDPARRSHCLGSRSVCSRSPNLLNENSLLNPLQQRRSPLHVNPSPTSSEPPISSQYQDFPESDFVPWQWTQFPPDTPLLPGKHRLVSPESPLVSTEHLRLHPNTPPSTEQLSSFFEEQTEHVPSPIYDPEYNFDFDKELHSSVVDVKSQGDAYHQRMMKAANDYFRDDGDTDSADDEARQNI
ncbi:uncharacterized protein LOC107045215 [Diachasma alloeum]|uniref:uncharacterized protein LOC107045215 n=1 Tax=Diachasma alloeum TaxID=454923 RepID=UPI0007382B7E|nr:uncharacterized protein LOC107045215 [Diachasma alloeum]XP_015122879.1 uncharacterized protein LOC107045215 [Diachasma alloeum]XP_015122880.1 uncharacterized protein LOC107045215 [Diachasma alloeum]XP_015122881.1 uncharacterized protein LOC107045215 [Diachasma alloeum]XP_015122882.1 uncharacterized protein LOC107045215 [Diachasma alloeum]XP_015122883.1 uncharacterized protein LOC107045215 [Diachasma alloeum]XP_015122884.1 uncharacterized protein LOC107045215 [Diachasma alloeum]XP_01512288